MYDTLKFVFRNGSRMVYPAGSWHDYDYNGEFFVVKDEDDRWLACFNAKDVFSVEMFTTDEPILDK